jgi:hypothetical protein
MKLPEYNGLANRFYLFVKNVEVLNIHGFNVLVWIVGEPNLMDNMCEQSVASWNPFVGCRFDCVYCESSFKRQAKRRKKRCLNCYGFKQHFHPERLGRSLPKRVETVSYFAATWATLLFANPFGFAE